MTEEIIRLGQFELLLKARTSQDVKDFLSRLKIADSKTKPTNCDFKWKPIGDSLSNAANIETNTSSISCLIERITNAFDANIDLQVSLKNKKGILPASPRKAVEHYFNIPGGDLGKYGVELSVEERSKLASLTKVEFYDSGEEQNPTISIRDFGTGQHPSEFQDTFLKLGSSNKISSPHLHGTYGHGGSSTYRFLEYSTIISRQDKSLLNGKPDLIGWTIIRKDNSLEIYSERDGKVVQIKKPPVYQYLTLISGEVPYITPDDDLLEFKSGSCVTHIGYSARGWHNLSRGLGFRLFRNFLFDPVLPFRLEDLRENSESFNRNIFGARSTLLDSSDVVYSNEAEEFLEDGGILKIRYWVLFDQTDPAKRPLNNYTERENSKNTIILTLNGQRHAAIDKNVIAKDLRLPNLSQCLLVQVEVDNLSREMKAGLFTSNRGGLYEDNEDINLIKEKLKQNLQDDDDLLEWERKLLAQISRTRDNDSTKKVKEMLNKLIKIGIMPGFGGDKQYLIAGGTGNTLDYKPMDPPTSLKFITKQDPIEITQLEPKKFSLEINGPDNIFTRRKNRAELAYEINKKLGILVIYNKKELENGRLQITLVPTHPTELNNPSNLKFKLTCDNLKIPLEIERNIIVIEPPIFNPCYPPTEFKFLKNPPLKLLIGRTSSISVAMNGPEDLFDRPNNPAKLEFTSDYEKIKMIRFRKPRKGRMQISVMVEPDAEKNKTFKIGCCLTLHSGAIMKDELIGFIDEPTEKNEKHGGKTEISLPNYEIQWVFKEDWANHQWDESSVGKFQVQKEEDGKDKLYLFINADNENITAEREKRIGKGQSTAAENLLQKYVAYMAYHLYLCYEVENGEISENIEEESIEPEEKHEITDTEKQEEYKRVSKTLILSFQDLAISNLIENES